MGLSPISGSNGILYVCTFYGNNFFLFMTIENVHHFASYFQLLPVLFSCAVSDFLYEEFSAMPIRAKITLMPFSMRMFLRILFVLLRVKLPDKSKLLCCRSPISSVGRASDFESEGQGFESHIGLKWNSLCLYFIWKQFFLVFYR